MAKKKINFEQSLEALEEMVDQLEAGELNLEDALAVFEKGIKLTRDCQQALENAEQKIQVLLDNNKDLQVAGDDFEDEF